MFAIVIRWAAPDGRDASDTSPTSSSPCRCGGALGGANIISGNRKAIAGRIVAPIGEREERTYFAERPPVSSTPSRPSIAPHVSFG